MDYKRIYDDFIKDRRAKELRLTGYVERHHIVPRSMGGGDEASNIIALTPEDHFFAHLLLAKAHGGKMSAALYCMLQRTKMHWGRRTVARGRYGLAQRMAVPALRARWTGEKNPKFNPEKHEWVNYKTGAYRRETIYSMHKEFGGSRATWTSVVTGARPSIKGWLLKERISSHKQSTKGKIHTFVNRVGQVFTGTQTEFCNHTGLSDSSSWRIVHQRSVSRCGWRLSGVRDREFNQPRSGATSGRKAKATTLERGGIRIAGDRHFLARELNSTPAQISASIYSLRRGIVQAYKGWKLVS